MNPLILSSTGGVSWDKAYWEEAWNNFMYVVHWMQNTRLLTLGGITFTFWNIGLGLLMFGIIADFLLRVFWGD